MRIPIPQKPNSSTFFTGRENVLDKLRKIFVHTNSDSELMTRRSCLLWGMGGIGKTQICLKFIEEMYDRYVSCEDIAIYNNARFFFTLVFHMCSGLMPPLMRASQCLSRVYPALLQQNLLV